MNLKCMTIRRHWRIFLPIGMLTSGFAAFMLSCSSDSTTAPTEPRAWYYESEFEQNPGLVATPDQVVILDIMPGEELSEHSIPYQYEEGGGYLFAIPSDDPFITRVEVFDRSGLLVADTERGDGGVYLEMSPGSYSIKVYHDGADVPEEGSVAFIRQQQQVTPQKAEETDPADMDEETSVIEEYPAYVAIEVVGGDYDGQYMILSDESCGADRPAMFKTVPKEAQIDGFSKRYHLFSFLNKSGACEGCPVPPSSLIGSYYLLNLGKSKGYFSWYTMLCSDCLHLCPPSGGSYFDEVPVVVRDDIKPPLSACPQDMGDGSMRLWAYFKPGNNYMMHSPLYIDENQFMYLTEFAKGKSPDNFKIVDTFRFYKDGTQITRQDLKKGQVALYEGENYTGVAVVLSASFSQTTLIPLEQVKSVGFGRFTITTVQFFSKPEFVGLIQTVGVDMSNNLDIKGSDIASIKIFDSKKVLISTNKCPYCNLAGVDLSDLSLDEADLSYANLMGASMTGSSLKKANMSHALLNGAHLSYANLSGASLYNAFLNSNTGLNLAAAILTGAYLKNANLQGADLGGAGFGNASLHYANCQGANMAATTFTDAYLAGTDFSSTTAPGADFSHAILTAAKFKGAKLDWASSTGLRTNFTGAFIGGADFTNATVEGANFENAYVNFSTHLDDYSIYFTILRSHTKFKGFNYSPYGDTPCVWVVYSKPTAEPKNTDSNNSCPDGSTGPCDNTAWTSPVIPRDQSEWKNSQGETKPSWCKQVDYGW